MQRLKQDISKPTLKSLSPESSENSPSSRSPRLPIIYSPQNITHKAFSPTGDPRSFNIQSKKNLQESPQFVPSRQERKTDHQKYPKADPQKLFTPVPVLNDTKSGSSQLSEPDLKFSKQATSRLNHYQNVLTIIGKILKLEHLPETAFSSIPESANVTEKEKIFTERIIRTLTDLVSANRQVFLSKSSEFSTKDDSNPEVFSFQLKIKNLKSSNSALKSEISDLQSAKSKIESAFQLVSAELKDKSQESSYFISLYSQSEEQRKRLSMKLKEVELEMNHTRNNLRKAEVCNETLSNQCQEALEKLRDLEEKAKKYEATAEQLESQNLSLSTLYLKCTEDLDQIKKLQKSVSLSEKKLENSLQEWKNREEEYQKTIQDLLRQKTSEKINEIQPAETRKLKRNTAKDEGISELMKDEVSRLMGRVKQAESEATSHLIENEKLKKDIVYYKELVKNKNEIIVKVEENNEIKEKVVIKMQEIEEKVSEIVEDLSAICKRSLCQNCHMTGKFIVYPCGDVVCKDCNDDYRVCAFCFGKVEGFVFNELIEGLDKILTRLSRVI